MNNNSFKFNQAYPAVNRRNARGQGPNRRFLPNYYKLGSFDEDFRDKCMSLALQNSDHNDIQKSVYNMSKESPLCEFFPSSYRQILLQHAATSGLFEKDFIVDYQSDILSDLRRILNDLDFFRARLSVLPPRQSLDWHIDTDTSVACRIQFILSGDASWSIDRKGVIESKVMRRGEIWFANTGYLHKVENRSDQDRWVLTLGCDYASLSTKLTDFRIQ